MDYTTSEAGNPFVDGWYADPDTEFYDGRYWVFPTYSAVYDAQTFLDAFSSPDLVHWTKHPKVLSNETVNWVRRALWAPSPICRNGKFYLYFAANDIQSDSELGGIGVGVADRPDGPYVDAIGKPLIGKYENGAQPIDVNIFIDDDGQAYLYYGGHSHANVVLINNDMISLGTFPDGAVFKEITPTNYVEGPLMKKRQGKYYFMWSEGGWTGPDYSVSYAVSDSPTGPFTRLATILHQDPAVATGSGHHGVINVPGTDIWYIVYHRRPLSETDGNHRTLAYDRLYFGADGTIQPVRMLVKDNFKDGNMIGWKTYGGTWKVEDGHLSAASSQGGKAMLDTNFGDLVFDADVTITSGSGNVGLVFRATDITSGEDAYSGYYAGISSSGAVILGKADGGWTQLCTAALTVLPETQYHMRITAVESTIQVFVDDLNTPKLTATDGTYSTGANGVRAFQVTALFDNVSIAKP